MQQSQLEPLPDYVNRQCNFNAKPELKYCHFYRCHTDWHCLYHYTLWREKIAPFYSCNNVVKSHSNLIKIWHTHTRLNFVSSGCFIMFLKCETRNQLKQDSVPTHCTGATMSCFIARCWTYTALKFWPPNSPEFNPVDYSAAGSGLSTACIRYRWIDVTSDCQ